MSILWSNNASTTLTSSITAAQTTITVVDGSLFPTITGSDYFYITLGSLANGTEIAKCTARSGNTFTLQRGQEGTVAKAFSAGEFVELRVTAAGLLATGDRDTADGTPMAASDLNSTVYNQTGPTNTVAAINRVGQALLNRMTYALARIFPGFAGNQNKALFVNTSATGVEWRALPEQYYVPIGGLVPFANQGLSFTDGPYTWLRSGVTTLSSVYPNAPYRTVFTGDSITTHTPPIASGNTASVAISGNKVILLPDANAMTTTKAKKSLDGGITWTDLTLPIESPQTGKGHWAIGYVTPTSLFYVLSNSSDSTKPHVFESNNDGATWVNRSVVLSAYSVDQLLSVNRIFVINGVGYLLFKNYVSAIKLTPGQAPTVATYRLTGFTGTFNPAYSFFWQDGDTACFGHSYYSGYSDDERTIQLMTTTDFVNFKQYSIAASGDLQYQQPLSSFIPSATGVFLSGTPQYITSSGELKSIYYPLLSTSSVAAAFFVGDSVIASHNNRLLIAADSTQPLAVTSSTATWPGMLSTNMMQTSAGVLGYISAYTYRTLTTDNYVDNMTISFSDSPQNNKPFYMRVA